MGEKRREGEREGGRDGGCLLNYVCIVSDGSNKLEVAPPYGERLGIL
jgi:hypothetical protein